MFDKIIMHCGPNLGPFLHSKQKQDIIPSKKETRIKQNNKTEVPH